MKTYYAEIDSAFHVKIMLCYILSKIDCPVTEEQLYEIVLDSGIINYFYYAESLSELVENGSVSKKTVNNVTYIELNEIGRNGSDYFNDYIPEYFHSKLLKSAYKLFARLKRKSETSVNIEQTSNGFEIECVIKDVGYDLMRVSLYAPGLSQAELIKDKILLDPAKFYSSVISFALDNTEDDFNRDILKKPKKTV